MTQMSIFHVSESIQIIQICFPMKFSKDDERSFIVILIRKPSGASFFNVIYNILSTL